MKIVSIFTCLLTFLVQQQAHAQYRSSSFVFRADSMHLQTTPAAQRPIHRFRFANATLPIDSRKWLTLILKSNQDGFANEVQLPVDLLKSTVTISWRDTVLELDEDYAFIADTNRIRIFNQEALGSKEPLKVRYQRLSFR